MNILHKTLRGDVTDAYWAGLLLLIATISLAIAFYLSSQFVATNPTIFGSTFGKVNAALAILVDGALVVYVAINLLAIVAAFFVKTHPIFAIAGFLLILVELLLSNITVNIFQSFISQSTFVSIGNTNLPLLISLFKILPIATLVFGGLILFAQFGKGNSAGNP